MSASPHVLSNVLRSPPTPLLLLLLLLLALSGGLAYGQVPNPITGIDDTANPQCRGQTVNAGFGVANVYESPQRRQLAHLESQLRLWSRLERHQHCLPQLRR